MLTGVLIGEAFSGGFGHNHHDTVVHETVVYDTPSYDSSPSYDSGFSYSDSSSSFSSSDSGGFSMDF